MSQALLNGVVKDTIIVAVKLAAPILLVVLIVGLLISIIQATTQIQEQTLTFVPKLIAGAIVGIFLGSWMLQTLMSFTTRIFELITKVTA
ncbi:flagellar biosynthesis protein FliQ [Clostridium botulinum]|uniref:Flagellar biosynthetic protein FliQ n=2 Tax=Clostridium TaxID=1485 RepID=B2TLW2_CLOBB|nr:MULTISPECIES: flagellar biosynthesis protein FliQ [unclassified Clostridium]ACD23683.1 flagellar biosynthetic protein FliQ [Clostridium botulinum B str. Eklund 17B (NRP)]AIY81305.1 flagellar biosynthetic protein FliQ [Clostridium botulinum 202F]KAI3348247.1 flagellar biosynthesis protein FliQ [Clostridium botulinum]KFX57933.1 flagellar biosynthesis protein FliQ [Clostridium botulinum]KFX58823.1 flagellar biosynthesis protein FliQ [Clostridium botulinum]